MATRSGDPHIKMISNDNSSSEDEEDSLELQRLKDAAVTLEPDRDLHAIQKISRDNKNDETNVFKESETSLRPKQTFSVESNELKTAPGFRTHVAKKLSDLLDNELEFSEFEVDQSRKDAPSDSGIRLLSSSKDFLTFSNSKMQKPKNDSETENSSIFKRKSPSGISRNGQRFNSSNSDRKRMKDKYATSSDSSEDEKLAEAAVSFCDIQTKDNLLSSFAVPSAPILVIRSDKKDDTKKDERKNTAVENNNNERTNEIEKEPRKKKKKVKKNKKKRKQEKECLSDKEEEENENIEKESLMKNKKNEIYLENDSFEKNEKISTTKKMKKKCH